MNILQKTLNSTLQKLLTEEVLSKIFIKKKAESIGVTLNQQQIQDAQDKIKNSIEDALDIEVTEDGVTRKISLLEGDVNEVEELLMPVIREIIQESINKLKSNYSKRLLVRLKRNAPQMLNDRKKELEKFDVEFKQIWGKAIDLLEIFIVIVLEAGNQFTDEYREEVFNEQNLVFDVLTRLHARACHISSEILTLLKTGYADGAHARWRSLHEITVVAFFIKEHGQDVAEQYLLHEAIESYKAAEEYQKQCIKLRKDPISEAEFNSIKEQYENLILQYGTAYKHDYGWAASALNLKKPTFKDIEESTQFAHLRPNYKHASYNVHATTKGVIYKLSLPSNNSNLLPTGPSIYGLVEPAHSVAVSLNQITTAYLLQKPNVDQMAICDLLSVLEKEIGQAFVNAEKQFFTGL